MSMYVRAKHEKTTYFLLCEPSDSILELKLKLQGLTKRPPEDVKLYHMPNETPLEDARSVNDHRIETDAVLAISFRVPESDEWEPISNVVLPPNPMSMDGTS